ncbi:MAG: DUF333 domain-containing protein [Burkholderiales bacterium]
MPPTSLLRLAMLLGALAAAMAHAQSAAPAAGATLANPASQHCVATGGKVVIEKNGAGGEYGVCLFADNLQCEEWALLRGQCRAGGIKVTGFATPAARYCAITGGTYKVTSGSNTPDERGTCTFKGGRRCDANAYFDGTCSREAPAAAKAPAPPAVIRAKFACEGGKTIAATFRNGTPASVQLALSDGRKLDLPQAMSASGARYANADESVVFWNKGNTAFLEENGKTTFGGCATR